MRWNLRAYIKNIKYLKAREIEFYHTNMDLLAKFRNCEIKNKKIYAESGIIIKSVNPMYLGHIEHLKLRDTAFLHYVVKNILDIKVETKISNNLELALCGVNNKNTIIVEASDIDIDSFEGKGIELQHMVKDAVMGIYVERDKVKNFKKVENVISAEYASFNSWNICLSKLLRHVDTIKIPVLNEKIFSRSMAHNPNKVITSDCFVPLKDVYYKHYRFYGMHKNVMVETQKVRYVENFKDTIFDCDIVHLLQGAEKLPKQIVKAHIDKPIKIKDLTLIPV